MKILFLALLHFTSFAEARVTRIPVDSYLPYRVPHLDGRFQCVFKKSVNLGASITHETMLRKSPALMAPYFLARTGVGFGESPAKLLTKYYARGKVIANLSAPFGYPVGFQQIDTLLRQRPDVLDQASVVVGIDLFYWDAAWEYCKFTEARIPALIQNLRARNIPLILGTVPEENPELVTWNSWGSYREYIWTPPAAHCLESINRQLHRYCRVQEGCFLLDLHGIIKKINAQGSLTMADGKVYALPQIRPDGVHVSTLGSLFLAREILRSLAQRPDLCQ
jgi:hypothetical protein